MNLALHKLGLTPTDRVVILHVDDVGVCEASVSGVDDLWQVGMLSSSSLSEQPLKAKWDADALRADFRGFLFKCLLQIRVYPENPRPIFLSPTGC